MPWLPLHPSQSFHIFISLSAAEATLLDKVHHHHHHHTTPVRTWCARRKVAPSRRAGNRRRNARQTKHRRDQSDPRTHAAHRSTPPFFLFPRGLLRTNQLFVYRTIQPIRDSLLPTNAHEPFAGRHKMWLLLEA
ncbi:hypothetical protein BJ166DRAFT_489741 [Pestalotiopsis sp. NC0098]|nr:hypothetical protein BJ166DRAFT_489741 [Pestalotiopsis sp. NC0098]